MNKKVLKTMIGLVVVFLVALYALKIFFPEQFVMVIENEQFIKIGNYIDTHKWAYYIFGICTSFLTYWFYLCACCRKWKLNWKELIAVFLTIGCNIGLSFVDAQISSVFSLLSMLILPVVFKGDLKYTIIVFCTHYLAQALTLSIRNLPLFVQYMNILIATMLTFEMYIWLILFYVYANYKKGE